MAPDNKRAYLHGRVITGITKLRQRDLHGALNTFSDISPEALTDIGVYTSLSDIARYISILGIVCIRREEIAIRVNIILKSY